MSAGIGQVPAEQTFLDLSQGNRVDPVLYDRGLRPLTPFGEAVPGWAGIVSRADSAPADIVPGLLASELRRAGLPVAAQTGLGPPAIAAAGRDGLVHPLPRCPAPRCLGFSVIRASPAAVASLSASLGGDDLLIALVSPPPGAHETLPIGIAGRGFDGDLTSDSTRTDGYVLSTDVAPTILRRFGLEIPGEVSGEPIRAEGSVDPGAIADRAERMEVIPERRLPLVAGCVGSWAVVALVVALLASPLRRRALAWLGLAIAYMPLTLLAGAALEPAAPAEALIVGLGAAALAVLTLALAPGWAGAAIACAATTVAYAIDVIAGSQLTALSLLGPDPVLGVRFYGIGNELEAIIAVLVPAGVGAALTALAAAGRPLGRRSSIGAFLLAGALGAVVFGAGRFGADIGAAIVLPVGAVVAAGSVPLDRRSAPYSRQGNQIAAEREPGRRRIAAVIATPFIALVTIALIDLVSGGNAHLTRSVLDTGGAGDLGDVVQRRLTLSAHDFAQAAGSPLFWLVIAGIAAGLVFRRAILEALAGAPMVRAALFGACAAVAAGVLVNDSGATFLTIGGIALGALVAYAWSQMPRGEKARSGK
jgi:hypothetical protein